MKPTCDRCGRPLECINITMFGDRDQRWAPAMDCQCPGPRCFACGTRLDNRGRCSDLDCYMLNNIIPIPDVW